MSNIKTIEQKIAEAQEKLSRLQNEKEKTSNAQKIVIGGMMLSIAKKNPQVAKQLLNDINQYVTRPKDKKRLTSIIDELTEISKSQTHNPQPTTTLSQFNH